MNELTLRDLYHKYINNQLTEEELNEFIALLDVPSTQNGLAQLIDNTYNELKETDILDVSADKANFIYSNIIQQPRYKRYGNSLWLRIAAVIFLVFSIGTGLYIYQHSGKPEQDTYATRSVTNDRAPASKKAVLTLANGSAITLSNSSNGRLANQKGIVITKTKDGELVYTSAPKTADRTASTLVEWNKIAVPRGGRYNLVLQDGTRVYLNSGSSLEFPTNFTGHERKVTLRGEAYFEVAKNSGKPFRVNVDDKQQVEVLGTHFNISAYDDENVIKTTLLEGAVKVVAKNYQAMLKPGQMSLNDLESLSFVVKQVDVKDAIDWKNELFVFNRENITSIMRKISRWYDVDVEFIGNMEDVSFLGNYSRKKSLKTLLKTMELSGKINFKVEGRRVTVIKK